MGYTNPFVCLWLAVDPDGRLFLYRQIYRTQRIVSEHAADIHRLTGAERIEATVADHDAEDRATLANCGIPTIPAYKAVERGIQAVAARLKPAGDGKPRLFVFKGSLAERDETLAEAKKPTGIDDEWDGYVWPKGQDGKPLKEEPVKENDHALDALRYGVAYLDDLAGCTVTAVGAPPLIV